MVPYSTEAESYHSKFHIPNYDNARNVYDCEVGLKRRVVVPIGKWTMKGVGVSRVI